MRGWTLPIWTIVDFILNHIFIVAVVVISGGMLLGMSVRGGGKGVSPLQVTQLINRGKTSILDVSTDAEYAAGHLRDAKHIPLKDLPGRISELDKFKGRTVVVVCQTGVRSAKAAAILQKAGFEDVVNLEGGTAAWQAANLPIAK
jgi:rhodanese-related sulfurtransferase